MNRVGFCLAFAIAAILTVGSAAAKEAKPLSLVVMDPLAAPLSCPCVEGYAQRKYEVLRDHLQSAIGRTVKLTFAESLGAALKKTDGFCLDRKRAVAHCSQKPFSCSRI